MSDLFLRGFLWADEDNFVFALTRLCCCKTVIVIGSEYVVLGEDAADIRYRGCNLS